MSSAVARLEAIVREVDAPAYSLLVANRTEVDPVQRLLEKTFTDQPVTVTEDSLPDVAENVVLLVRDGEVVATSALEAVMDSLLLVNSDLYRTGTSGVDRYEAPAVLTRLADTAFDLRGYPASNREKLLLVVFSRYVERLALERAAGTLYTHFQEFSRVDRELGTARVYRRLGETDVDVHVYGVPDRDLPADWDVTVHAGDHEGYRRTWSVVFVPPDPAERHAALLAMERGPNEWTGVLTYDRERVERIRDVVDEEF